MKKIYSFFLMALVASAAWAASVTFDFAANGNTMFDGITASDTSSDTGDFTSAKSTTSGDVTLTVGAGAKMYAVYGGGIELRMYSGSSMTIAAAEGQAITSITFTNTRWSEPTASTGSFTNEVWSGSAASVNFSFGAQSRLTKLVVTVGEGSGDPDPDPETVTLTNFKNFADLADGTEFIFDAPMVVTAQVDKYLWVRDYEDGYASLLYGDCEFEYENGDIIPAGWKGTKTTYKTLTEVKDVTGLQEASGVCEENYYIAPIDASGYASAMADETSQFWGKYYENEYVFFGNVLITAPDNTHNFTIADEEDDDPVLAGYDKFGIEFPEDLSKRCDVYGIVQMYNGNVQIYPLAIEATDNSTPLWKVWYQGEDGDEVTISDRLYVVQATKVAEPEEDSKDYIYVTDNATTILYDVYADWGYVWEQEWTPDCFAIDCQGNEELYNQIAAMQVIEAGTLNAVLASNYTNPRLLVTEAPVEADVTEAEANPEFAFRELSMNDTINANGHEIVSIEGVCKMIDGKPYLMGYNDEGELWQPVAIDTRYIGENVSLADGASYAMPLVVIKQQEPWEEAEESEAAPARLKKGLATKGMKAQAVKKAPRKMPTNADNYYENYVICPLNTDFIVTAVRDINATATVNSVKYVNVAGQTSDRPFDGVNIVVTRMSDGTTRTAKVVR